MRTHLLDTAQRLVAGKGFASMGLKEMLEAANVPKGSFYHYFASKEAFGTALLGHYFEKYLAEIDVFLLVADRPARVRLASYWAFFRTNQERDDPDGKCLAVKLGAEVSDMSEDMRLALDGGTSAIVSRLARLIDEGAADGSVTRVDDASATARILYQLWIGASLMWKISHDPEAFADADLATEKILSGNVL